jgi:hypothetical protein
MLFLIRQGITNHFGWRRSLVSALQSRVPAQSAHVPFSFAIPRSTLPLSSPRLLSRTFSTVAPEGTPKDEAGAKQSPPPHQPPKSIPRPFPSYRVEPTRYPFNYKSILFLIVTAGGLYLWYDYRREQRRKGQFFKYPTRSKIFRLICKNLFEPSRSFKELWKDRHRRTFHFGRPFWKACDE